MKNNLLELWSYASTLNMEERTVQAIDTLVVSGHAAVVIVPGKEPRLSIASDTQAAIDDLIVTVSGKQLTISNRSRTLTTMAGGHHSVVVYGDMHGMIAGGDIYLGKEKVAQERGDVQVRGERPASLCIVKLEMPTAPDVEVSGCANIVLSDLQQDALSVAVKGAGDILCHGRIGTLVATVSGAGDIKACGQANSLKGVVSGAGDLDASRLSAKRAELVVSGAGDIDAHVTESVNATVSGAGDIAIRGNPPEVNRSISGVGRIKLKKKSKI